MKLLILSCNTGGGHNTAAYAIKAAAEKMGHEAEVKDYLLLAGEKTSKRLSSLYINTAKYTPHLFGAVYNLGQGVSYLPGMSPIYYANKGLGLKLKKYIDDNGFDVVAATHLYPAEALTFLKKHRIHIPPTIAVATDYTCIPFWNEIQCDAYVSPHESLRREYIKRNLPGDKIYSYGIPVDGSFSTEKHGPEAKKKLGFDPDKPLYLIMGGSMGFGRIPLFTKLLYKYAGDCQIAVICGSNAAMKEKLDKMFANNKDIRIIGFTKAVADYMAACDVVYTKPGGLSSTEALVSRVPTIHTAPIPGCETRNYRFFGKQSISLHASNMVTQILYGKMLVENKENRRKMLDSQQENAKPDAASNIVKLAEKMLEISKGENR